MVVFKIESHNSNIFLEDLLYTIILALHLSTNKSTGCVPSRLLSRCVKFSVALIMLPLGNRILHWPFLYSAMNALYFSDFSPPQWGSQCVLYLHREASCWPLFSPLRLGKFLNKKDLIFVADITTMPKMVPDNKYLINIC